MEFYYTYKKHVKIGRSGTLMYGEAEPLESRTAEEEMEHKVSQRRRCCCRCVDAERDVWGNSGFVGRIKTLRQSKQHVCGCISYG